MVRASSSALQTFWAASASPVSSHRLLPSSRSQTSFSRLANVGFAGGSITLERQLPYRRNERGVLMHSNFNTHGLYLTFE